MADVTVFVDDAVLGRLPAVCAKDGTYTDDRLTLRQELGGRGGLGILWLLVLVGPFGWLALVIISLVRGSGGMLTVRLPFSEGAYERLVRSRRQRWPWGIVTVVLGFATVVYLLNSGDYQSFLRTILGVVAALIVFICLFGWVKSVARFRMASVDMDLDASRRWVTLSRVHPNLVAAVQQQIDYHDVR